jgi:CelD/BcsL family acetyltransferase involved in cellulose biosynthesis
MTPPSPSNPQISDEALRSWEGLAARVGRIPTQDAPWTLASLAAFAGTPSLINSGTEAIAPLVRNRGVLELPGCRDTGEPVDFLAASPQALAALTDAVAATGMPLLLERLPAGSGTVAALREAFAGRASLELTEKVAFPTIALDERWAEPGGGLSSSRRSALRRGRRKAEKQGEVAVELLSPGPEEVEALLDEAFAIEARSWKGEEGTAVAFVPRMEAFYRAYAAQLAQRGQFRLDFLRVGGRPVAMQFGAVWRDAHWLFKIGYDAAFAGASPGQLLLAESVAGAARAGLGSYELFGAQAQWTDPWTASVEPCCRVLILPRSPRGALGAASLRRRALEARVGGVVKRGRRELGRRARAAYVTGPDLPAAMVELERCTAASYATTVGYWPLPGASPEDVTGEVEAAAATLPAGSEVSLKLADLGAGRERLGELLEKIAAAGLTLHIDALGIDSADETQASALQLNEAAPGKVGCTLPGRWARSADDALALHQSGLRVRVVKGEFEDPDGNEVDSAAGFLAVVEAIAGGNCHVEVATHDLALASSALEKLIASGTSCELQILYAMPATGVVRAARKLSVPVRIYLPYGGGRIPYDRARFKHQPALLATFARDLLPLAPRRPPGA